MLVRVVDAGERLVLHGRGRGRLLDLPHGRRHGPRKVVGPDDAEPAGPPHGHRLQVLATHDAAYARAARGLRPIHEDERAPHEPFSRGAYAGHPYPVVSELLLEGRFGLEGRFAPEKAGVPDFHLIVEYP